MTPAQNTTAYIQGFEDGKRAAIAEIKRELPKQGHGEPVALKVYRGELCYKSQADDQSFGMWCPVTQDFPFPEGTKFYTTPQQRKPPEAGDGSALFYEAVRILDNAIFAQSGDVVRHDSAAHREALDFFNHVFTRLDLTPSQQRKPLTDEQIGEIATKSQDGISPHDDTLRFARAIEAAHGIKE